MVGAIIHVVYCIWLSRNALRFSSAHPSLHDTMAKITSFVAMSGMNSNGNCLPFEVVVLNNFLIPLLSGVSKKLFPWFGSLPPLLG